MRRSLLCLVLACSLLLASGDGGQAKTAPAPEFDTDRNRLIAFILSQQLPAQHFSHEPLGDELSRKMFDLYLRQLDPRKRFLLQADVRQLNAFAPHVDDELKQGKLVYDLYAMPYEGDDYMMIILLDYSYEGSAQHTEFAVMQAMQTWATDYNGDSKSDAKNLKLVVTDLLGTEHPVFRYDMKSNGKQMNGAFFVLKQGTTFAMIIIDAVDPATIDGILKTFYVVK